MFDPIGGFNGMIEQFLSYLETAYRIDDPRVSRLRRELLTTPGQLALDPIFEAVARYESVGYGLEGLLDDPENRLAGFSRVHREAFVELALAGLFDRDRKSVAIKGAYEPYLHQIEMLAKGVRDGSPGIVTSGTGSGKTESFMLPILAQLAREATGWPAPDRPLDDDWLEKKRPFRLHRRHEHPDRPKAVRALILYPLNALVEDQMVRLRKALDSHEARSVMDRRFAGNRIFFGRYTGKTPVTGFLDHPRLSADRTWKARNTRARRDLKVHVERYRSIHRRLAAEGADDELRFIFPKTEGGELISRWDMQATPPDILVTNQSILNAMLVREVDDPILSLTKAWLMENEDARFHLVLDELHLIRGSAGAEMAGLLKILVDRLGLSHPDHAHKLRILASSASLPMDEANAAASIDYLRNMFGDAGIAGSDDPAKAWRDSVVTGKPIEVSRPDRQPAREALADLARSLDELDHRRGPDALRDSFARAAESIPGNDSGSDRERMETATRTAAAMLDFALQDPARSGAKRPRSVEQIGRDLFGEDDRQAVRGLLAMRAIPDLPRSVLPEEMAPRRSEVGSLPGFRMHGFVRNIEGMFASIDLDAEGAVAWGAPSVERGQDYDGETGVEGRKRLFEMLYCEACGDLYLGGKRGGSSPSSRLISLLPAPQELEQLPEISASLRFEDASYREFALFWPGAGEPESEIRVEKSPYRWNKGWLDPRTGVVGLEEVPGGVPGRLLHWSGPDGFHARTDEDDGTAVPYCCAKCGTDYSGRYRQANSKKRQGRLSPIRSFRTGFGKTSQLLATELVAALKSQGGDGKLVAFSDSREDAANLALEVEVQHQRDLRREILIAAATRIAAEQAYGAADEEEYQRLKQEAVELMMADRDATQLKSRLDALRQRKEAAGQDPSVPLKELFEFQRDHAGDATRPILTELMKLGSTPVEGADTFHTRVSNRPWYKFFNMNDAGEVSWKREVPEEHLRLIRKARDRVQDEQPPDATDLLFSKTYFALEETGLGWPSFYGPEPYDVERSRDDAMLRVFADAYRITPNHFQEDARNAWRNAGDMLGRGDNRLRRLMTKLTRQPERECEDFLAKLRTKLKQVRGDGSIDISMLYFRAADPGRKAWRCERCGRVHLHAGFDRCTRCGEQLFDRGLSAKDISDGNFLGRRVKRAATAGEPHFRLKCEELTGQTSDPATRLQQFKGVFVREENESDEEFGWRKLFDTCDLLSVTTTMEVGVDIGSLQAVYQGNMPPQRFNYQQRVGRAGRRGQAFSTVLTVCRSKSHDIHYFRNPIAITGSAPPPPFITTGLVDIPSRLLRKFWLVEAFDLLRREAGATWTGDAMVPGDIHGEFLYCSEYFRQGSGWRERLAEAMRRTDGQRRRLATILAAASRCDEARILAAVTPEATLEAIDDLEDEFGLQPIGIAAALAERGLVPLYGMPTRSRNLYVELRRSRDGHEAQWDTIDRDQDMAIFDFAPGSVRTREKLRHRCIGFTGPLRDPDQFATDFGVPMKPFSAWWKDDFHLRFCGRCGAWSRGGERTAECPRCDAPLMDAGIRCVTPGGYRTDFRPTDQNVASKTGNRITLASLGKPDRQRTLGNLSVNFAEQSEIFLVNPGFREETRFTGFQVRDALDNDAQRIWWWTDKPQVKLADQAISADALADDAVGRYRPDDDTTDAWLASTKVTNSLQIGPVRLNGNLRLLDMDIGLSMRRDPARTSVRAAAISATEILVQRAALDLDIAPEEFDALAPNILATEGGERLPYLQISDSLPNGSGFCRHLLGDSTIPVSGLIASILDGAADWPRKAVSDEDHMRRCETSCYVCLQRYNNRNLHGLLDWRLGLSYLRALADPGYDAGFAGRYECFEVNDWSANAAALARQTATFIPGNAVRHVPGRTDLPVFSLDDRRERWGVVVHPLWDARKLFDLLGIGSDHVAIDSFELSRRPLLALQRARLTAR